MQFRYFTIHFLLGAMLFLKSAVIAEEKMVLTLEQSVAIALEKNPEIRIAEKEVSKAKAGVWEAYSSLLPSVDASANFQKAHVIQEMTMPNFLKPALGSLAPPDMPDYIRVAFAMRYTFVYGAMLNQPLFLGGAGLSGIRIANAAKRASVDNLESKRQNLIYDAVQAFYSCLLARDVAEVQQVAFEQAQANLEQVRKKFDVGTASGFDKMRAQVDVANLKPEVITAENNYQLALTSLRMILGLPENTVIDPQGKLEYVEEEFGNRSLENIQVQAMKERPEISAVREQKTIASAGIVAATSNYLPKLFFQGNYSYQSMQNDLFLRQSDFSKGVTTTLSLQVPLFHGGRSTAQFQKALLERKIAQETDKKVRDGIAAEAEMSYNRFNEAKQKYASARESIDLAEEAMRLANLMYEEGASTQLDVMGARLALTQARLNYVSALYEYQMARYQLRKAAGILKGVL
jgi:outer membrane protein